MLKFQDTARTGPYRERAGFDLVAQGASGLMSITGPGQDDAPVKVGAPVTDITAGILALWRRSCLCGKQKRGLALVLIPLYLKPGSRIPIGNQPLRWRRGSRPKRLVGASSECTISGICDG